MKLYVDNQYFVVYYVYKINLIGESKMFLMLWLVLCTGVNLIVIHPIFVVILSLVWLLLDCIIISGVHTRLISCKNSIEL